MRRFPLIIFLALECASAEPVLSEFMASNDGNIVDGDGQSSDWIEIHNPTGTPIDLTNWRLRDSTSEWTFPSTTITGGGYLIVFASGQELANCIDAGGFLHTTFKLDAAGEEIALVRPNGSVASEFANPLPPQRPDISYGVYSERIELVVPESSSRYHIPLGPVPDSWRGGSAFDDTSWSEGAAAIGFGTEGSSETFTAYQVPEGTLGNQTYSGSLGLDFIVMEPILVTELGIFDSGSDGLTNTLTTQLWSRDDRGTPGNYDDDIGIQALASIHFTPASPGTLEGGSRFKALAEPLTLAPGNYTITGSGFSLAEPNGNLGTPAAGDWESDDAEGALQFIGRGRYGATGSFPANLDGGPSNRYAAGTFKLLPLTAAEVITDIGTAMKNVSDQVYERIEFNIPDPNTFSSLTLEIAYDDGFTAWINGQQIASHNASTSTSERGLLSLNLAIPNGLLNAGTNILALEGRNLSTSDNDFLLRPTLVSSIAGTEEARYFDEATPGAPNSTTGFRGFVADTEFDIDRGFYTTPFNVKVTSATEGASIITTINGSEPSESNGAPYTGPIAISTTTVLRARAYKEGFRPTDIDTQTYLFADDIARQTNTPAGYPLDWAGTTPDYGMTSAANDYARAAGDSGYSSSEAEAAIAYSLTALPSLSIVTNIDNLFDPATGIYVNPAARGQAWERPVSLELIHPDGTPGFQENAGIRMMGFSSRNITVRKLHLRLLFKNQYGAGTLDYPFFGEDRADRINTIALRGNRRDAFVHTNNATYIGDEWAKRTQSDMGQAAVAGNFAHVYLNGLYWGVYNPSERPDDAYAESYFGGERADYDVVKFCCPDRAVSGDIKAWNDLLGEARAGIDTMADFQRVQGNFPDGSPNSATPPLLDVDNLADYLISGQYHGAWDWPGNYYAIRDRVAERTTGYRFFTWDNDVIFDGGNPSVANKVTPVPGNPWWTESPGEIDIGIRANPEYRIRFADRVYQHYFHDGALSEGQNLARWNELAELIRPALFAESARWGDANSSLRTVQDHWDPMNARMINQYFPARQAIVFDQMRTAGLYPSIDPPEFNQRGGTVPSGFSLAFTSGQNIYFTTDGSDPRLPGGNINPGATPAGSGSATITLVPENAPARALVPSSAADDATWAELSFDDTSWQTGTNGIGYDNGTDYLPIIGLDLFDTMREENETAYIRIPFGGVNPGEISSLNLRMRYDDGFIAYLNGVRIAAINEPVDPDWNSGAIRSNEASTTEFDDFDVSSFINQLRPDGNILAIHGMNRGVGGADFVIQPLLEGVSIAGQIATQLTETVEVKARVFEGGEWSALNKASFIVGTPASSDNLLISEIYYNPPGADESGEFIELYNFSANTIDLSGVQFTAGITYQFPLGTTLASGARLVLNPTDYEGQLANGGEEITLSAADESIIASLIYGDSFPWPDAADEGYSMVFLGPDPRSPSAWRSSLALGGTPGSSDSIPFNGGDFMAYALPAPQLQFSPVGSAWTISFSRPLAADDARYELQFSPDLNTWTTAGIRTALSAPDHEGVVTETISGIFQNQAAKTFARVRVFTASP
ncbi:lamin tail domain-containing protein [Akkermansiaceae bacterium]|nr:lamin tail domain-containing protein [Akkermansiaceae bacterium]